jgi:hypothetical protein
MAAFYVFRRNIWRSFPVGDDSFPSQVLEPGMRHDFFDRFAPNLVFSFLASATGIGRPRPDQFSGGNLGYISSVLIIAFSFVCFPFETEIQCCFRTKELDPEINSATQHQ